MKDRILLFLIVLCGAYAYIVYNKIELPDLKIFDKKQDAPAPPAYSTVLKWRIKYVKTGKDYKAVSAKIITDTVYDNGALDRERNKPTVMIYGFSR